MAKIDAIRYKRQILDPYFDIKLHFEDEVTTDDKDEQESLLIIGRGTYMEFDSKSGIAQQIFIMNWPVETWDYPNSHLFVTFSI